MVVYTLCPPKYRRSLNPSLVESLIPYLGAVVLTYLWDLSPEGFLSLSHSYIIPPCSAWSLAFFAWSQAFSASNFFFKIAIFSLEADSWTSVYQSCFRWPSHCLLAPSKAVSTFFLSRFALANLIFSSYTLFSATWKASTVAMRLLSSSFIYWWEQFTISSALNVTWIAYGGKKHKNKKIK